MKKKAIIELAKTGSNALDAFLNEEELMKRLPLSRPTIKKLRDTGRLPFIRFGKRVCYDWPTVRAALLAN